MDKGIQVFLMIRRHKTTIFKEAKESSTVFQQKRVVRVILQRPPEEQRLYKDDQTCPYTVYFHQKA
uniref:Uncharacterized protein n=1 Tax=Peromyscus maniculatus bairdii TaxID=230844 RepID=A0A8C8W1K8_PERMB